MRRRPGLGRRRPQPQRREALLPDGVHDVLLLRHGAALAGRPRHAPDGRRPLRQVGIAFQPFITNTLIMVYKGWPIRDD